MPYPQPFIKVVASGTMLTDSEIWSTSWSMADPDTSNDAEQPILTTSQQIAEQVSDWFERQNSGISQFALLDTVKVNRVGTDGRYSDSGETTAIEYVTPKRGGATGPLLPPQCSVAVSLRSEKRRGPGAFGRFYPPMPIVAVDTLGLVPAQTAADMAVSAATLVSQLNLAAGGVLRVVNASTVGAGAFEEVTRVRVGRVVDTIRKRRSALAEDYQDAVVDQNPVVPGDQG